MFLNWRITQHFLYQLLSFIYFFVYIFGEIMECFLHVGSILVLLGSYRDHFFWVADLNISNKNPLLFLWIYPFNFQMFIILLFHTVRDLNYSSFPYLILNLDPNYIIQRYSFLLVLQNIIITIITSYGQVVKTCVFFCINSFYLRLSHLSIHRFIITALLCINNSTISQLCLWFNCSIQIFFS